MELTQLVGLSPSALSQHLSVLREAGLVAQRHQGKERYYKLEPQPLRQIHDWVTTFERFWDDKFSALGEYLERQDEDKDA